LFRENLRNAFCRLRRDVPVLDLTSVVVIGGVGETGNITDDKDVVPRVTALPQRSKVIIGEHTSRQVEVITLEPFGVLVRSDRFKQDIAGKCGSVIENDTFDR
jgi:hypothetical protein